MLRDPVMCVFVEASRQSDSSKAQQIWNLLSDLYTHNMTLSELSEDRRKSHAAELVVAAWNARQSKLDDDQVIRKPEFVTLLEAKLADSRKGAE